VQAILREDPENSNQISQEDLRRHIADDVATLPMFEAVATATR
jgi:hypothetical protein